MLLYSATRSVNPKFIVARSTSYSRRSNFDSISMFIGVGNCLLLDACIPEKGGIRKLG